MRKVALPAAAAAPGAEAAAAASRAGWFDRALDADPHWLGGSATHIRPRAPTPGAAGGDAYAYQRVPASVLSASASGIDYDLLRRREPILWFEEVCLFESELDDNGSSALTAKVRVMPSCFFVLLRFVLRIDTVLLRIVDTRLFHRFGDSHVVRECTWREEAFESLTRRTGQRAGSKFFHNPAPFADSMPLKAKRVDDIPLL